MSSPEGAFFFDTPIGRCAIAWSARGIVRVQFPEATEAAAVRRLAMAGDRTLAKPPPRIARAVDLLCRHLAGDLQDFGDLVLDTGGLAPFHRFAALAEAIVYQQLTGKAAATIFARLLALYPGRAVPKPLEVLATPDASLRQVGLSAAKVRALKDLAEKVSSGVVPPVSSLQRMSDEEIVERLIQVRGIGRWTAQMLLIFRLARPDVLPVDDYGVRKGFAVVFRKRSLPSPQALARYGARWRPYRTVASWYLWRALELSR